MTTTTTLTIETKRMNEQASENRVEDMARSERERKTQHKKSTMTKIGDIRPRIKYNRVFNMSGGTLWSFRITLKGALSKLIDKRFSLNRPKHRRYDWQPTKLKRVWHIKNARHRLYQQWRCRHYRKINQNSHWIQFPITLGNSEENHRPPSGSVRLREFATMHL